MKYRAPSYADGVFDGYIFEKNLQGDIVAIYDLNTNKVVEYKYDAWGNFTVEGTASSTIGVINPFRYREYYFDNETGLYYLQSRYYNSNWGRFLNADDIAYLGVNGEPVSYNLFAYCLNNPINGIDETGNFVVSAFVGALIGGAVAGSLIGMFSYLINWGGEDEFDLGDFLNSTLTGAAMGALGASVGAAFPAGALGWKLLASAGVGLAAGVKVSAESSGSVYQRLGVLVYTTITVAGVTFLGSLLPTSGTGFFNAFVTNYASTLFFGAAAEGCIVAGQAAILSEKKEYITGGRASMNATFSRSITATRYY